MTARDAVAAVTTGAGRAVRVTRGLANPATRGRYAAEVRRRLGRGGATPRTADGSTICLVCGGVDLTGKRLTYARDRSLSALAVVCETCGYIHLPEHVPSRYRSKTAMEDLPDGHPRLGTMEVPGREFHMAKMAIDILGGRDHAVLMFGAGRSLDNHHIGRLPRVSRVAISDIMKVRDDAEFVDANNPPRDAFSVVVASEVIEHFRNPHEDFARLLGLVRKDGLLVCGTNIHDGGMLARDRYIYYPDHTSYYSPQALRRIARRHGVHLDFRSPLVGQRSRKRYVLLSRSGEVMEKVADYFGQEPFAPSEVEQPATTPQRSHQRWRGTTGRERHPVPDA